MFIFLTGSIPLRVFSEWWLAKEKFSMIDSFIHSSFPGATFHGCNGLSVKYQVTGFHYSSWNKLQHHYFFKSYGFPPSIMPFLFLSVHPTEFLLIHSNLYCMKTATLKWTRHVDTWQILKIHMTRVSDTRVGHVSNTTRLHDRSVCAI